jgi:flagellar biosynthesis/type III secretory pathway protein FliH
LSSSGLLRRAVFEDDPLVIDNSHYFPPPPEPQDVATELVEELQQEHPDAAPEIIAGAVQDAIEQLLDAPEDEEPPAALGDGEQDEHGFGFDQEPDASAGAALGLEAEPLAGAPFEEEPLAPAAPEAAGQPVAPATAGASVDAVLDDARREAERVLAEADARAAEIERAAYEKGYQEGLAAGSAEGQQQAAEMLKQATAILDQATELHDTMLRQAEPEMLALCLEMARKIIQAELRTNPDVVKSVLSAAVQKINGSPRVTVKVNPAQVEAVREHWQAAYGPNYREKEWVIEGDPQIIPGGCVLETKYGSLDAQIPTQFGEIQHAFALLLGTEA